MFPVVELSPVVVLFAPVVDFSTTVAMIVPSSFGAVTSLSKGGTS